MLPLAGENPGSDLSLPGISVVVYRESDSGPWSPARLRLYVAGDIDTQRP